MNDNNSAVPRPPKHLTSEAKTLWRKLNDEFDLSDSASQILLESALSAFDRWQSARKILARDGPTTKDRWGVIKAHPCVGTERDAKSTMRAALHELHLDLEPLQERGRPPGRK
jgi:P27 family predicted phage terminase small subunit